VQTSPLHEVTNLPIHKENIEFADASHVFATLCQARYGLSSLKDSDLPRFKLFKKGADTTQPIDYSGESKPTSIMKWIVQQTGVFVGVKVRNNLLACANAVGQCIVGVWSSACV